MPTTEEKKFIDDVDVFPLDRDGGGSPSGGPPPPASSPRRRELSQELVDQAIDRVRAGLPVGELPDYVRGQLTDGLIDELLEGRRGEAEVLGPDGLLGSLTRRLIERVMHSELSEHLGYDAGQAPPGGAGNSRNGDTPKTVLTDNGAVRIERPRDRNGTYRPQIVKNRQRRLAGLDEKIIALYAGGMTTREIETYLGDLYGPGVGRDTVSRVTASVLDDAKTWQTRPLDAVYPIVYLDALVVKIRDGQAIRNFSCYLAIGVNTDGERDVLGMWFQRTEGAKFWLSVLTELKQRGLTDVLVCCVDGLTGFPQAIEAVFPETWVQTCLVHQVRASMRFVPYKDRRAVASDLKTIYTAVDRDHAETELERFAARWDAKYPMISASWIEHFEQIVPFLAFPPDLRRAVYTTNTIEALNRQIRKTIKTRGSFPTEDSARKLLYLSITRAQRKWRHTYNWRSALTAFRIHFGDRIPNTAI